MTLRLFAWLAVAVNLALNPPAAQGQAHLIDTA